MTKTFTATFTMPNGEIVTATRKNKSANYTKAVLAAKLKDGTFQAKNPRCAFGEDEKKFAAQVRAHTKHYDLEGWVIVIADSVAEA